MLEDDDLNTREELHINTMPQLTKQDDTTNKLRAT